MMYTHKQNQSVESATTVVEQYISREVYDKNSSSNRAGPAKRFIKFLTQFDVISMSSSFNSQKNSGLKSEVIKTPEPRIISLSEVNLHDSFQDCWMVLFNEVYDLTPFMMSHPGGAEVLLENAGRDATLVFQDAGHTNVSLEMIENYKLGTLPEHEKMNFIFNPIYESFKLKT